MSRSPEELARLPARYARKKVKFGQPGEIDAAEGDALALRRRRLGERIP